MESTSLNHLHVKKFFIQRDYSEGTIIKFETNAPSELEPYISEPEFTGFMLELNAIYAEAEKVKFCEGCCACLTAYLLYSCIKTHKQKCMEEAAEFIKIHNTFWKERGVTVFNPINRGFRILEIQVIPNTYGPSA